MDVCYAIIKPCVLSGHAATVGHPENKKYKYIHLGLIIIGIKGMIKKEEVCKLLLIIQDDRWSDVKRKIIALTESDLNENRGLFYCSPDFFYL